MTDEEELIEMLNVHFNALADAVDKAGSLFLKVVEYEGGFCIDCGDFGIGVDNPILGLAPQGEVIVLLMSFLSTDRNESHGSDYSIELKSSDFESGEYLLQVKRLLNS